MTKAAIKAFVLYLANEGFTTSLPGWFIDLELYGGKGSAISAVSPSATACALHRESPPLTHQMPIATACSLCVERWFDAF